MGGGGGVVFQMGASSFLYERYPMGGINFDGGFQKKSLDGGGGCPPPTVGNPESIHHLIP